MIKSRKSAIMESTLARIIIGAIFLAVTAFGIYLYIHHENKSIMAMVLNLF